MNIVMILRWIMIVFLMLPFIVLISQFPFQFHSQIQIDVPEFLWVLRHSLWQSFLSATFSVVMGFLGALGLLYHWWFRKGMELLALAPFFTPPLFIILSLLSLIPQFPMGLYSVVFIHVVIHFGFIAHQILQISEIKLGAYSEASVLLGTSRPLFFRRIFFPLMKHDLAMLWFFVFVSSLTSFAVPMMVGGVQTATLEIMIYEIIRYQSDWSQAIGIALIQTALIFFFSFFLLRNSERLKKTEDHTLAFFSFPSLNLIFLVLGGILLWGLLKDFRGELLLRFLQSRIFFDATLESLKLAISVSFGTYCLLCFVILCWKSGRWAHFMTHYMGPTPALTAFSMLIFFPTIHFGFLVQASFALILIGLPFLMKSNITSAVTNLQTQLEVAELSGASDFKKFLFVTWPQLHPLMVTLSAFVGVWALGDYSVSKILATRSQTLSLYIESLSSNYRISEASNIALILIFVSVGYFLIFRGAGNVFGEKLIKNLRQFFIRYS